MPAPDPGEATTTLLRTAYNAMSAAIYRHVEQAADAGHTATRTAEQQLQAALGPRQYQQLRRDLAIIAHLHL